MTPLKRLINLYTWQADKMDLDPIDINISERRSKPRVNCDYPAIIRGHDPDGKKFEENARVINLSAGGVYALLNRYVQNNSEVSVNIALPTGNLQWGTSRIATTGVVVRGKIHQDSIFGIGIKILRSRF
jgi:PilZ domain